MFTLSTTVYALEKSPNAIGLLPAPTLGISVANVYGNPKIVDGELTPITESEAEEYYNNQLQGLEKYKLNEFNTLDYPAKPRWPLDEKAAFLKGAGVQL